MVQVKVEGNLVEVISGDIFPAEVVMEDAKVLSIRRLESAPPRYILPGLIDGHIHIESSQMCPSRFAEAVVPHGTTSVVSDPHEIANVTGMAGIDYMVKDAQGVPLRIFYTAPSCVPATPFETSGAVIGEKEIEDMLSQPTFVALGEVMDFPGVIRNDPVVIGKIKAAKRAWKSVDGHCPGLVGKDLVTYINAGISTDHESVEPDEAEEKYFLGMWIQVREGSAGKDLRPLLPFAKRHECMMVSDDLHAIDIAEGHLDVLLRKAVAMGVDPLHAIRTVTAWPAWHYYLPGGSIAEGRTADIVVVDDLKHFNVLEVYIAGELVAKDGKALFKAEPMEMHTAIFAQDRKEEEIVLRSEGEKCGVRVIEVMPRQIESRSVITELPVIDGRIRADPRQDVLWMAVANRYAQAPLALGFIKGMGLTKGAMASTVAHDSHNIVAVGTDEASLIKAINEVSRSGGYYVTDGIKEKRVILDVAGLMSTSTLHEIVEQEEGTAELLQEMGCKVPAPFMTLSFQCLLVIPELKMSDKGLFDSTRMEFVPPVI